MKIEQYKKIEERANKRKNGVYSFQGIYYGVKDRHAVLFAYYDGTITQLCFGFNVELGKVDNYKRKAELVRLLAKL